MNSIAVGIAFDLMMSGTVSIAEARFGNGTSRLIALRGSRRIAFVTMPSVPSEPTIRLSRL